MIKRIKFQTLKLIFIWLLPLLLLSIFFINGTLALDDPEQKVEEAIKDYILTKFPDWTKDEIRISFRFAEKTFDELRKGGGNVSFKVAEIYPDFKPVGNVIFPIEVSGEFSKRLFLRAKVEVIKKIVIAAKRIKKGKVLEESDLELKERDVALFPQKYYVDPNVLIGKEAKISIPAESTIFQWMVGEVPIVRQGSEVTVLVASPGLMVKTKGEALEDGYLDSEIKVKRKGQKKIFTAKVISANEVEVEP